MDDLKSFKNEELDFVDKSLTILMYISAKSGKSNISKQALTSIFTNNYCFNEIIQIIRYFMNTNILDYEAHMTLIFEILFTIIISSVNNSKLSIFLLEYGGILYEELQFFKNKLDKTYEEMYSQKSCIESYDKNFECVLSLLSACNSINTSNKSIDKILDNVNDACFDQMEIH